MAEKREPPSNEKEIQLFLHYGLCLQSMPPETSASIWAYLEVGWTEKGLQVWCKRHEVNVCHIDFEGVTHVANTTRKE